MPISDYSTTPANNNATPPNGFPEGMAPSDVNNSARQVMADIRTWYEDAQWIDYGYTPTYVGAAAFRVGGNRTAIYSVGRRVKISDSSTLYGVIATSTFNTPNTDVTVTLDSGSITIAISAVALGIITPSNNALPDTGVFNNYTATTNPTVNDDTADGYSVGSRWVNTSTDTLYECLDASAGAAVWRPSDEIKAGGSAGVVLKNSGGTTVATLGSANTTNVSFAGKTNTAASASGGAGLNIAPGTAPSSPTNGDVWTTSAGVFARVNGATKQLDASDGSLKNLLINSMFRFNERAASSVADDAYCFDRWYNLNQTANVTVSAQTDQEDGQPTNIRITQPNATAQRFGIAQIIESASCRHLRGGSVAFSGRIRCSQSQAIRYAILEWTGTADTVTSDVVNNWTSGTFTTGNFFNSTTLTLVATGSVTPSANTWTAISGTGSVSSSMNNLIAMVWVEGTLAQNETLDIGKAQLESGASATTFEYRPVGLEYELCRRYYQRNPYANNEILGTTQSYTTSAAFGRLFSLSTPMRVKSGATVAASAAGDFTGSNGAGVTTAFTSVSLAHVSDALNLVNSSVSGTPFTIGQANVVRSNNANAYLEITSEL